jgi:hypothetical protein
MCSTGGHLNVIVFQGIVGVGIGGDDFGRPMPGWHLCSGRAVLEEHLFAEAAHFVTAVLFRLAQDAEIGAGRSGSGGGLADGLHAVIERGNAVNKIEGVGGPFSCHPIP